MNHWITRSTAILAAGSLLLAGGMVPATAAHDDGANWPQPSTLGLTDCMFSGPFIDAPYKGVFADQDVPRRRWSCSSFDVTFAVARYSTTAQATAAEDSTIGAWHSSYARTHKCDPTGDAGGCGTIRRIGDGRVFAGNDSANYGVKVTIPTDAATNTWGWTQGAWARNGTYVAIVEQTSLDFAGGYFSASELFAAAKNLATNPPSGIAAGSFPTPTTTGGGSTSSPAANKKHSKRAKANAAASGTRAFAKQRQKRYNRLTTPTVKQLRANGTSKSAAKKARFSGFRPRPSKQVWINVGGVCLRAKGKTTGAWKKKPCPNVRWNKARR